MFGRCKDQYGGSRRHPSVDEQIQKAIRRRFWLASTEVYRSVTANHLKDAIQLLE